ncbi:MAG: tRNA pseudouridine(54/55) synthase Pus10 [Candidatus Aenigmarchaeota archaeon]|nr:tRNA pseudouridine(54/55) synthase Pus10 [Candidatus Aenigmarchaeota archaeon]
MPSEPSRKPARAGRVRSPIPSPAAPPALIPFRDPAILTAAKRVLAHQVCDHCLGRQFARVSTGLSNAERGRTLRQLLGKPAPRACSVCDGLFTRLDHWASRAAAALEGLEFRTFRVGSQPGPQFLQKEEDLWEEVGIEHCEPLKSEVNREVGKLLERLLGKKADRSPDVTVVLDLAAGKVAVQIAPLYVFGAYQKLVRGIPQTKWETYATTVEDIIARPFMRAAKARAHALHGMGREDIDARCLAWRPFVLELEDPRVRTLPLRLLEKQVNRSAKVQVRGLQWSSKDEVRGVKAARPDKTYRLAVRFAKPVKDLRPLKALVGIIMQQTPQRVLHRRADLLRKRRVKALSGRLTSPRDAVLEVRGEAGLYVKELVTGDGGRTTPSVAAVLGPCQVKTLDVIQIHAGRRRYGTRKLGI